MCLNHACAEALNLRAINERLGKIDDDNTKDKYLKNKYGVTWAQFRELFKFGWRKPGNALRDINPELKVVDKGLAAAAATLGGRADCKRVRLQSVSSPPCHHRGRPGCSYARL